MKKKIALIIITSLLTFGSQVEAQSFREKMKAKIAAAKKKLKNKKKTGSSTKNSVSNKVETTRKLNEWHTANEGKVVFYNNYLKYNNSNSDSQTGVITKGTIGGSKPFYARVYFGKSYKKFCADCQNVTIRYSMGGVSLTAQQVREEQSKLYFRYADALYYYDTRNYSLNVPLSSDKGHYYTDYSLQEDAYRILLSRVKSQLKKGATLTLKIEIIGLKDDQEMETVMATGEIQLTVINPTTLYRY